MVSFVAFRKRTHKRINGDGKDTISTSIERIYNSVV
jgi:hypothetical protein